MRASRRTVLGGLGLAPFLSELAAAQGAPGDPVDPFIRERMEAKGIPGAGVAVLRPGQPPKVAAYGQASMEFNVAATTATLFPMASSSKLLAGFAAGRLTEAGRLDLDAPARNYLPELPEALGGVRVHHLLSHTSGLRGPGGNPAYATELASRERREAYVGDLKLDLFTDEEILRYGAEAGLQEPPGTRWRYSQFPFFLFGQIVARLSGKAYHAYVQDELLTPLGIAHARFGDHRTVVPGRNSTNYTRQFGPLQNYALRYTPGYWPAAGLNISAAEAALLLEAFRPGRLLRETTLQRLWRRTRLESGEERGYGLAATVSAADGRTWVGHEGGGCCYVGWWPEQQLGIMILLNLSGSREDGIEQALAARLLG